MTSIKSTIEQKLRAAFSPSNLEIFDESHKHAGHSGNPDGKAETHIGIIIVSEAFTGKTRLARARGVHLAIADEIKKIHAITMLKTLTKSEFS